MSDGPIAGGPVEVVVERRAPGGEWVPVFQLRDVECPLGVVPEYRATRPGAEAVEPTPVVLLGRGHDDAVPWAVYTTREAAQAVVDGYDAAVRAAEAAGQHGICHVGDLWVASAEEVPTNPTLAELYGDAGNLYLRRYFEPEGGE